MSSIRLPAEWEKQNFVQLVFPHKDSDWNDYLEEAKSSFLDIVKTISKYQKVVLCGVNLQEIKQKLKSNRNITIINNIKSNDTWSRDFGGITTIEDNQKTILNFKFNGWGKKYQYDLDDKITLQLKLKGIFKGYNHKNINFVLEGGSIDSNGDGVLLTTTRCLLEKNRNPKLKKLQIEQRLKQYLGIKKIIWLENGALKGDDTDSHIDTLARFVSKDTIVYQTAYKDSVNYKELSAMEKELKKLKGFNIVALPPIEDISYEDEILPATYANFLIINGAVLVPTYNDKNDKKALDIFKKLFPKRDVIGIDCSVLIRQHGSLHCVTMQYI